MDFLDTTFKLLHIDYTHILYIFNLENFFEGNLVFKRFQNQNKCIEIELKAL